MQINGPNKEQIIIENIILDLNGTLAVHGKVSDKTKDLILRLQKLKYNIVLISGDIRGNAATIANELGLKLYLGVNSNEKAIQMQRFDKERTVAIGNARIDIGTFENKFSATVRPHGVILFRASAVE